MSKGKKPRSAVQSAAALRSKGQGSKGQGSKGQGSRWGTTLAVVAVVLFAALVGMGIYFAQQPDEVTTPPNATANGVVVGQPDAPVTIDVYEDFHCPHCAQFEQQVGPTLEELAETGEAKVVYHPVAFFDRFSPNEYSSRASAATGCAAAAGVFSQYAELLFANQPAAGEGLSDEQLIALGEQAGATGDEFATCVGEEQYAGWTAALTESASQRGITGTPTVLVNGEPLEQSTPQGLRQAVAQAS